MLIYNELDEKIGLKCKKLQKKNEIILEIGFLGSSS